MTTKHVRKSKTWHVGLWVVQVLIAGMFLAVGLMKTLTPIEALSKTIPLAGDMPVLTRFIGISEFAGGLGLLLPAALRIRPQLTVTAAALLTIVMVLAVLYHIVRGEYAAIGTGMVLGIFTALIAWGRVYKAPITAKAVDLHHTAKSKTR